MIRQSLAGQFGALQVAGEISDLTVATSGHCYFSLKDGNSRISAVIWRSSAQRLGFRLEEGQQVVCRGGLEVYGPRGVYQLVVSAVRPVGTGPLELAFQQLYRRLKAEGLFESARKRPLPFIPQRIAVITSPQGAAIRDFVQVLSRRWPAVDLVVVPTRVQGEGSAQEIAAAIQLANRVRPSFDILVVCRGGGSLEDLWAFNEEAVCRAVYGSRVPVVSGVGHEIDVTLCDLTADLRALTPTEAAERIVPDRTELQEQIRICQDRMAGSLGQRLRTAWQTLDMLASRPALTRPLDRIAQVRQRLDELALRLFQPLRGKADAARHSALELGGRLESLSPLAVLKRGYALAVAADGRIVRRASDVQPGDPLSVRMADASLKTRVLEIEPLDGGSAKPGPS